jgi:DNA polymerase-1
MPAIGTYCPHRGVILTKNSHLTPDQSFKTRFFDKSLLMSGRLYIIDVFSLMFQVYHAIPPMTSSSGLPTNAVYGFTRDIIGMLKTHQPSHLICATDSPGPGERDSWYPEYKANRSEMPVDLVPQVPMIESIIRGFCIPLIGMNGWEADDVIATLTRQAVEAGLEVRIVSSDKDCRQLLGPQVQMLNCRKNELFSVADLHTTWGITPEQVTSFQGLVGDSVDNVPGVPQIGPKKATALLEQFGTLENVLANASLAPGKKVQENLVTYADQARISQKLATLNQHLPLDFPLEDAKVDGVNLTELKSLFQQFGFRRFKEEVEQLKLPNLGAAGEVESDHLPMPDVVTAPAQPAKRDLFSWSEEKVEVTTTTIVVAETIITTTPARIMPINDVLRDRTWHTLDTPEAFAEFIQALQEQSHFTFDLETTSLNSMNAEIVGWAICWKAGHAYYLPVQGPAGDAVLDGAMVLAAMKPLLENPDIQISNQNIKYDMLVLKAHGVHLQGIGTDPMVAHYLLDAGARSHGLNSLSEQFLNHQMIKIDELIGTGKKQLSMKDIATTRVSEYASEDADASWRLSELLGAELQREKLWDLYWDLERPLISTLCEMEFRGIKVDAAELRAQSAALTIRLDQLKDEIRELAGEEFNIDSPKQLQEILFNKLQLPVQRKTKTGASTDQEVLEKLAKLHPLPEKIIEHRQFTKLKGTYLDTLPTMVNEKTGRVHTSFNQVVAATGRLSSNDPNLQNIPIRTEEGRMIRKAFVPGHPDWILVCADYSQIELRILAEFSGDEELINAFIQGKDIHTAVAAEVFHVDESQVNSEMRRVAKAVNFGIIYGQSPFGLAEALGIPQGEAAKFIDDYFAQYPGVEAFMTQVLEECVREGYARTILGRRRPIEGIKNTRGRQRNMPERTAINTVIQGSAADLIKRAMINIENKLKAANHPGQMLLQIHDELVFEVPREDRDSLIALIKPEMEGALPLKVPIVVDVKSGANWYEVEKL